MITVALWFLTTLVVVALAFVSIVVYSHYQDLKRQEKKRNQIAYNCRLKQKEYRDTVQELQKQGWLTPQQKQTMVMLISNYFVFQSINEVNCRHFYELLGKLSAAINKLNSAPFDTKPLLSETFQQLADRLPKQATQYTANFYLETAPKAGELLNEKIDHILNERWAQSSAELNSGDIEKDGNYEDESLPNLEELDKDAFDDYTKRALELHTQRSLSNEN